MHECKKDQITRARNQSLNSLKYGFDIHSDQVLTCLEPKLCAPSTRLIAYLNLKNSLKKENLAHQISSYVDTIEKYSLSFENEEARKIYHTNKSLHIKPLLTDTQSELNRRESKLQQSVELNLIKKFAHPSRNASRGYIPKEINSKSISFSNHKLPKNSYTCLNQIVTQTHEHSSDEERDENATVKYTQQRTKSISSAFSPTNLKFNLSNLKNVCKNSIKSFNANGSVMKQNFQKLTKSIEDSKHFHKLSNKNDIMRTTAGKIHKREGVFIYGDPLNQNGKGPRFYTNEVSHKAKHNDLAGRSLQKKNLETHQMFKIAVSKKIKLPRGIIQELKVKRDSLMMKIQDWKKKNHVHNFSGNI